MVNRSKKSVAEMPAHIPPMLCTLVKEPIESKAYLYELKWDGYRIISYTQKGKVRMDSRGGLDYTKKYPPVVKALADLRHDVIIDGEVVVFGEDDKPDFEALQLYNGHDTPIQYCVFDLLWLDGQNLMDMPLVQRKGLLKTLLKDHPVLRYSESFDDGMKLYEQTLEQNLEGIVAKERNSAYMPGSRNNAWLKIPTRKRQEFVIGGWAESDKSRAFRSLLFGAYENGEFIWYGRSGGGYKQKDMPAILAQLKQLEIKKSPFFNKVLDTKGAVMHWVKPELVANFEFAAWTKSSRIRKPATFLGFRQDKNPKQVVHEIPKETDVVEKEEGLQAQKETNASSSNFNEADKVAVKIRHLSDDSNWHKVLNEKVNSSGDIEVEGHQLHLTNVEKQLWKGINKAALISYYNIVAANLLPYLKDRPLSLLIKNLSAAAPGFFIKDMEGMQPAFVEIFSIARKHPKKGKENVIDYMVCNNLSTLIYLINLGCIDLNPWNSRTESPLEPDFIAIDLDPSDNDFQKVVKTALAAKTYFDKLKLKTLVKTSGKTGIHIFIPCKDFNYPQARWLAKHICKEIHVLVPDITTLEVSVHHRGNKLFVDFSQNDEADTLASVYSVRPSKIPTVSAPLEWKEVNDRLSPEQFTMETMPARLERKGDLFKSLLDTKVQASNSKILKKLLSQGSV